MRVTPLEIRQKSFEKHFRGYDRDEVNAFLLTLSQEWEKIVDENKELRIKLESAEREVSKLREVEGSLYKTLKTAEDTGANVIEQARQAAELHLRESQLRAEAMLNEAKTKAKDTIDESEMRAKQIVADMEERLKTIVDNYKSMESYREDLIADLKRIASDALERAERAKSNGKNFDPEQHFNQVKREAKKIAFPNLDYSTETPPARALHVAPEEPVLEEKEIVIEERVEVEVPVRKVQRSFFDEIG